MTSGSNDDLISAVTLGSGNLPAPISECVSEKKKNLKSEVQELLVLSENRKEQIHFTIVDWVTQVFDITKIKRKKFADFLLLLLIPEYST